MSGPRSLVLRNLARVAVQAKDSSAVAGAEVQAPDQVDVLQPGWMRLYSFYEPSLKGGDYTITVGQKATFTQLKDLNNLASEGNATTETLDLPGNENSTTSLTQHLTVVVPRFQIDENKIHSTFPPQGEADQPNILPHIIFNDEHLPWARDIQERTSDNEDMIPWLALFPFDCNDPNDQELRLTTEQLTGPKAIYQKTLEQNGAPVVQVIQQSSTFTLSMTVREYLDLPKRATTAPGSTKVHTPPFTDPLKNPETEDLALDYDVPVEVIFVKFSLFKKLFPIKTNPPTTNSVDQTTASMFPDLATFRYLSHARDVNTQGIATTSNSGISDTGVFSVLHSKRSGPTDIAQGDKPRSQAVHLISLELVDEMEVTTILDDELIAFVSLSRWTYLCQPPQIVNFVDSMRAIGDQVKQDKKFDGAICSLRAPPALRQSIMELLGNVATDPASSMDGNLAAMLRKRVSGRLSSGYQLVRYRTPAGESAIAWSRGVLSPIPTPKQPTSVVKSPENPAFRKGAIGSWPASSNSGQDYQIFDESTGLIDLTYSCAWQTGKLIAGSDQDFVAALLRHRDYLHQQGAASASQVTSDSTIGTRSRKNVISNLHSVATVLHQTTSFSQGPHESSPDLRQRWTHNESSSTASKFASEQTIRARAGFAAGVQRAANTAASAQGVTDSTPASDVLAANSTDWTTIHNWILDKLYLSDLPTHYLVGDPSYLPVESIRFFHIDQNWMQCFIDGALSVADHMANDDDTIRESIRTELNKYFSTAILTKDGTSHYPQVPRWGFFLRSAVVRIFTDLVVQVPYPGSNDAEIAQNQAGRSPVLVQKHLGADIMMVLLDRTPDQIKSIIIQQPAHQQRFACADILETDYLEFLWRIVHPTDGTGDFLHEMGSPDRFNRGDATRGIYDWDTQCIDLDFMADYLWAKDDKGTPNGKFSQSSDWLNLPSGQAQLSSAFVALQLNDTIKYLELIGNLDVPNVASRPYHLRTAEDAAVELKAAIQEAKEQLAEIKDRNTPATVPTNRVKISPLLSSSSTPLPAMTKASTPAPPVNVPPLPPLPNPEPVPSAGPKTMQFDYTIYPSTSPSPGRVSGASFLFVDTGFTPDLIFSINIRDAARQHRQGLWLKEVDIRIPLGDAARRLKSDDPAHPENRIRGFGLAPDRAIPAMRARMLNNQRWIVHMSQEGQPATYLTLRLIPRSLNRVERVETNVNLSFILQEVDVVGVNLPSSEAPSAEWTKSGNVVTILVTEMYASVASKKPFKYHDLGAAAKAITLTRKTGWQPPNLEH